MFRGTPCISTIPCNLIIKKLYLTLDHHIWRISDRLYSLIICGKPCIIIFTDDLSFLHKEKLRSMYWVPHKVWNLRDECSEFFTLFSNFELDILLPKVVQYAVKVYIWDENKTTFLDRSKSFRLSLESHHLWLSTYLLYIHVCVLTSEIRWSAIF